MFLIERLWYNPMENNMHRAVGYAPIGVVSEKKEAESICNSVMIPRSDSPWPLDYIGNRYKDERVPMFIHKEVPDISGCHKIDLLRIYHGKT